MLIPHKPSSNLMPASGRKDLTADDDVVIVVVPFAAAQATKIGRAKPSGRTQILNARPPQ